MRPSNDVYPNSPPQRRRQIRDAIGQVARAVLVVLIVVAGLAAGLAATLIVAYAAPFPPLFLAVALGGVALVVLAAGVALLAPLGDPAFTRLANGMRHTAQRGHPSRRSTTSWRISFGSARTMHTFGGLCARLASNLTAHTLCIYINRLLGRADALQIKQLVFPS